MKVAASPEMLTYCVITNGHGGLMARFDEAGRLAEWTPYIKRASLFATADAGMAAIRAICRREIDAAIRTGRAVREMDEATGETVVMDYSGRRARPLPTPAIRLSNRDRSLGYEAEDAAGHMSPRRLTRDVFRDARRNPTRQTEALITVSTTADEYTTPVSRQGRIARMAGAFPVS